MIMKFVFNGSNTKNTPQNLQLNYTKVKRTSYRNSLLLMHENENFKSEFLEMVHKILNDLSNKKEKMICSMSFATFNMTTFLIKDLQKFITLGIHNSIHNICFRLFVFREYCCTE